MLNILGITILYFFSRLQNLTAIPVFADEAIYIRWSQIIKSVETLRFIPLTDGKQPFFMWLTVPFLKIFSDPLFASRFVSVLAGFGTLIAIYLIVKFLTNNKIALFSSLIYILLPFSFFFDRLALADNLLSMFSIWSLYLVLLIIKYPRFDLSMILGIILGLAWLTKSPAIYFIVLSFAIIVYKQPKKYYLPLISTLFAFCIYNILRLGPQFHMIALRNQDYIWPIREILKHPLDPLKPHIIDVINIYKLYIGIPIILLFFTKFNLILFAWYLLPLIATCAMAKVFTARYMLFSLAPLIIIMSLALNKIKNKYIFLLLFLSFIPNIIFIYKLSTTPFNLKLTSTETGYLQDWTSGWGIKEASVYLKERAKVANIIVGTEGYFGTLPDGLQIYTNNTKQLTVFGVGNDITQIPEKLIDAFNHGDEVYLLFNQNRINLNLNEKERIVLIKSFSKPQNDSILLYKIIK
jgi:hypothetical protein